MINLGERIRTLRKSKGVTANSLAKQIGVTQSFISAIENGQKKCSLETLAEITAVLDISLADFFASESQVFDPSLKRLLLAAEKLTKEEREQLAAFLETMKNNTKSES